jgi:hypothetical protein
MFRESKSSPTVRRLGGDAAATVAAINAITAKDTVENPETRILAPYCRKSAPI